MWEKGALEWEEMLVNEAISKLKEEFRPDAVKEEVVVEDVVEEGGVGVEDWPSWGDGEELGEEEEKEEEEEHMEEDNQDGSYHWNENSAEHEEAGRIIRVEMPALPKRAPKGSKPKTLKNQWTEEETLEDEDCVGSPPSEESAAEEEKEAAETFAQQWLQQGGEALNIPKRFTPCKFFFKAWKGCKDPMCQFSHNAAIFGEEPYASFFQNLEWERKGRKTFTHQDYEKWEEWEARKKQRQDLVE